MRTGRSYVATAIALGIITLSGCAAETADEGQINRDEDWGDEDKYPEIGGAFHSLNALTGTCVFASGVVTVTSTAAQTIIIGKRAVDSAILINGAVCNSAAPVTAATSTLTKRIVINGADVVNEVVVLDFLGGLLAPGVASATGGGIAIDLGTGSDEVRIRGTSAVDAFVMGSDGLAFNTDNFKDITFADVELVSIALGGSNDTFSGTNPATPATKGVVGSTTIPLFLYGGVGNDTFVGGAGADTIYGGPGADILSGGLAIDTLYGEEGADVMQQGALLNDGADVLDCGEETADDPDLDVVSYALRTAVVTATVGGNGVVTGGDTDAINANCEGITGGTVNDVLTGDTGNNTLSGGLGNDTLVGLAGDDILNGNEGDDTFTEEGTTTDNGGDVFNGGAGTDTVDYSTRTAALTVTMDGTAADDGLDAEEDNVKADVENLLAGTGNDNIEGNALANVFTGDLGDDVLSGMAGDDTFLEEIVDTGSDTFIGGAGTDLVDYSARTALVVVTMGMDDTNVGDGAAGEGDDVQADVENLRSGDGIDNITGNDSANDIRGGDALDVIDGGDGDDFLDGETDDATIVCGGGTDISIEFDGARHASCEL